MNEKYTIILDTSHGGEDFGNSHKGFHKKDYTLYIVNYLKKHWKISLLPS
ncbi:MAG: N-acetylmuramoyl-L-alanine amidase [bacterium]|nr:N-acetylmuramoyl-L-alanine amidase [bacterium]